METNIEITLGVIALVLALAFAFLRRRSGDRLRSRFGPEYARAVEETGGRQKAEARLHEREKRVHGFTMRALTPSERERYIPAWRENQAQFVDDPKLSVVGADQLLSDLVGDRGYPVGDFEQRSADLSVNHAGFVQNYRAAHEVAIRQEQDETSTEELRQALLSFRALFDELVGEPVTSEAEDATVNSGGIVQPSAATPSAPDSVAAAEAESTAANRATTPAGTRPVEERTDVEERIDA